MGKVDGFFPEQLISLINRNTPGEKVLLGKIDLLKTFSFFEVESGYADTLIDSLKNAKFNDRKVVVEVATEKPAESDSVEESGRRRPKWTGRNPDRFGKEKRSGRSRDFGKGKKINKKERKRRALTH
jgi:ATP-dependent RNA helicase DeaD